MKYCFFLIFKLMKAKKILAYSQIVHIIVIIYINFNIKITLNIVLVGLVSKLFVACFYNILKFFKFCIPLITNSTKALMILYFYLQKFLIHFLMFMSKNYKLDFGQMNFLFTLPWFCPNTLCNMFSSNFFRKNFGTWKIHEWFVKKTTMTLVWVTFVIVLAPINFLNLKVQAKRNF
jgi:hypothetical protein